MGSAGEDVGNGMGAEAAVNATFGPFVESLDQRIFGEADAV
jgi:hypothetical protein